MRWPRMLYRINLRPMASGWPIDEGGRENLDSRTFLQQAEHRLFQHLPGALFPIAEESTTWPMVTQPTTGRPGIST